MVFLVIFSFKRTGLKSTELSQPQLIFGGICAGIGNSFFRTPIERVKTWSQIHGTSTLRSTVKYYINFISCQ